MARSSSGTKRKPSVSISGRKKMKQPKTTMNMAEGNMKVVLGDDNLRPAEAEPIMKKLMLFLADYCNGSHLTYHQPIIVELTDQAKGFLYYPNNGNDYERASKLTHFIVSNNSCEDDDEMKKNYSVDPCMTSDRDFAKAFSNFHFAAVADKDNVQWTNKGIKPIHPLLFLRDPSKTVVVSIEELHLLFWHMSWFWHTLRDDEQNEESTFVVQLDHWCNMIEGKDFKANFNQKIPTYPNLAMGLYKMFEDVFMYKINAINQAVDSDTPLNEAYFKSLIARMKNFTDCLKWSGEKPAIPAALGKQLQALEKMEE